MTLPDATPATILLADDHPDILQAFVVFLESIDFEIVIARDGAEAIERACRVRPDIILLDVLMPDVDGFETCRRLKADPRTRDIPVIFMTALSDPVDKVRGFEAGGVDYVTKPLHYDEVLARLKAHLTIRAQQRQLEAVNAAKDKFFSIIAHDLKSPVAGFLGLAGLLEDIERLTPDKVQRLTRQFRQSAEQLLALLDNLLTWSRLQRGLIECQPERIPIKMLVERSLSVLNIAATQKRITMQDDIPPELLVYGDMNMLDTVIRNALSNAIKFTPPGGTITVRAVRNDGMVCVSITDTGIGIPADKLPELFRLDAKTQRAGTAGEQGTGLGLLLCKEFIEKNGGSISIESQEHHGSTVSFTIPAGS